jgi:glycosyltransferase involved in cell wall biosynthesis
MHESTFKPEQHITLHPAFNAISFVSNWQAGVNRGLYPAHWKSAVIRNALNPVYKQLFSEDEDITSAKINPPLAIYTGKAPRGVLNLLALWPYLHSAHPQWQLAVFCNPAEGLGKEEEEKWYNRFRELPGLIHIGEVAPRDHAAAMRRGQVLLMPNPAYETSCIALMEAMASGMRCVITGRAALPETAHEYALVAPMDNANDPIRYDLPIDITAFLNQSHRAMTE